METRLQKAFDFAQEATKQLIGLSTGIIALTITFLGDVADSGSVAFLQAAWVLYLVSVILGILTLLTLAGNLERPTDGDNPTIYGTNIRTLAIGQVLSFAAALGLTLIFGFTAV